MRANTLRSDMFRQFDASIFKNFNLPKESVLSFRATEFFNVSNTTSFNAPNVFNNTSFGTQVASNRHDFRSPRSAVLQSIPEVFNLL